MGGANMCVIAGYAGSRLASPVLIQMIERQEGLAGGFCAGLAVVEPGSLHWRKVVGVMADLRRKTSAEALPGCVGVAHSRFKSGGDAEWAHPFVACFESVDDVDRGQARAAILEALSHGKPLHVGALLKVVERLSPNPAPQGSLRPRSTMSSTP